MFVGLRYQVEKFCRQMKYLYKGTSLVYMPVKIVSMKKKLLQEEN